MHLLSFLLLFRVFTRAKLTVDAVSSISKLRALHAGAKSALWARMRNLFKFTFALALLSSTAHSAPEYQTKIAGMPTHVYGQYYEWKLHRDIVPYHYVATVIECSDYLSQRGNDIQPEDKMCIDNVRTVIEKDLGRNHPNMSIDLEVAHNISVDSDGTRGPCWDSLPMETRGNFVELKSNHLFVRANCDKDTVYPEQKVDEFLQAALVKAQ